MHQSLKMQDFATLWSIWNILKFLLLMGIQKMLFFWHVTWKECFHLLPSSVMNKLYSFTSMDIRQEWTTNKLIQKADLQLVTQVTVRFSIHQFMRNFFIKDWQKAKPKFGLLILGIFYDILDGQAEDMESEREFKVQILSKS